MEDRHVVDIGQHGSDIVQEVEETSNEVMQSVSVTTESHLSEHDQPAPVQLPCNVDNTVVSIEAGTNDNHSLDVDAEVFVPYNLHRIHPGRIGVSLLDDLHHVQHVQAGGVGIQDHSLAELWNTGQVNGQKADTDTNIKDGCPTSEMPFQNVE